MLNVGTMQVGAAAMAAAIDHATLHTAQPDASGSNRSSASPVTIEPTATNGAISVASTDFVGGEASGPCTHIGFWDGEPDGGGTFRGWEALTGDLVFNSSGEITVTSVTISNNAA